MARATIGWFVVVLALPLAACADPAGSPARAPSPPDPVQDVRALIKADGWREELSLGDDQPFALVELAFDEETAERAWQENVPDGLPEGTGAPADPGRYGDLGGVDFATHALVVWSSGESGSCPAWLAAIATDGAGVVELTTDQRDGPCTDDFHPYRMLLVAHRDLLPEPTWLPTEDVVLDGRALDWGGLVREYP